MLSSLALTIASPGPAASTTNPAGAARRIDRAVAGSTQVPGAIVLVRRPGHPDWSHATGVRAFGGSALTTRDEFRIASVTKTYVAAALLRLVEQDRLTLRDPIADRLSPETTALLLSGGYDPHAITIADVMAHRAGLRDYAVLDAYAQAIGRDPGHYWTAAEQIAMTVAAGKPLGPPDTDYVYSDAGYVLIGEIIERATGQPLASAVPALLRFDRLELSHSYWEPVPDGVVTNVPANRAHAYQDGVDTAALNPSFDIHGGGGLVAPAGDILDFLQALLEGRVFDRPETLALMQAPASRPIPAAEGKGYGLGLQMIEVAHTRCWGHKGHWSTIAFWCPARHSGFVVTLNAAGTVAYAQAARIMAIAVDKMTEK